MEKTKPAPELLGTDMTNLNSVNLLENNFFHACRNLIKKFHFNVAIYYFTFYGVIVFVRFHFI
jgi:hypothetical protein